MKTNTLKLFMALLLTSIINLTLIAQNEEDSNGLDEVYEQLSVSFKTKNASTLKELYAEDCFYLAPEEKSGVVGLKEASEGFKRMFENAQANELNFDVEFKLIERVVNQDLAYDVGYYKLNTTSKEQKTHTSHGKFTHILKRDASGNWKIKVDSYSLAPEKAFTESIPVNAISDERSYD